MNYIPVLVVSNNIPVFVLVVPRSKQLQFAQMSFFLHNMSHTDSMKETILVGGSYLLYFNCLNYFLSILFCVI